MKKVILILISVFLFTTVNAQDVIFKKNGDEINAKVEEVGVSDVKYKKFDNQDGPLYTLLKSEIFMIKYANGVKEVFTAEAVNTNTSGSNAPDNNIVTPPVSQEQATVIIYRKNSPSGWTVVYDVYADTKYMTKIQNNTYFATKLDPGLVSFNAQTEPPKVTASMNLEPGKTYYLRCGVSSGMWVGRPSLEFVSESVGSYETSKMKK